MRADNLRFRRARVVSVEDIIDRIAQARQVVVRARQFLSRAIARPFDRLEQPDRLAKVGIRAHRIGQSRHVFAYRLIARDTVEERVLELQQRKRHLADAILTADKSLIRDLKREDLELLLS